MKINLKTILTKRNLLTLQILCLLAFCLSPKAMAQGQPLTNEEKFHEIFTTAGYATAFGAALGAATLSFQKRPENHLRFVAVGASLGFIGGSLLGAYTVFSPVFLVKNSEHSSDLVSHQTNQTKPGFGIHPVLSTNSDFDQKSFDLSGISASLNYPLN